MSVLDNLTPEAGMFKSLGQTQVKVDDEQSLAVGIASPEFHSAECSDIRATAKG